MPVDLAQNRVTIGSADGKPDYQRREEMPIIISKEAQQFAKEIGEFFVKVWRYWVEPPDWDRTESPDWERIHSYWRTESASGIGSAGYIRCPPCMLAGKAVPVKDCFCHRQRSFKLAS